MPSVTRPDIQVNQRVCVYGRADLGYGEVVRVAESGGHYQADVVFEGPDGRRLETFSFERLQPVPDLWQRLTSGDLDAPLDFLLKQLAYQFPLANSGGELSNSRTALLPHQILLTHDVVAATRRRLLIADEVGLGKTIEAGMIVRELAARGEAARILIICPAGLTKNWQNELRDAFRLHFDILGLDFIDASSEAWETHLRVIASIDTIKRPQRMSRLLSTPRWDVIVIDEAHHLTRRRYGKKLQVTQNYRLAEGLRGHTRDLLFLTATPHQGDGYQFWSLIQLLDESLFETPDAMVDHRGLLNRVMVRRTKREATNAEGQPLFARRQVHTQKFSMAARERAFYDRLTDYLREGYDVAGLDQPRTTSRQRAVGFVMATFQKIMSSSPRAIRQALRRRLLVLLAREQMHLEARSRGKAIPGEAGTRILQLQGEMRELAIAINGIQPSPSQWAEADAYVAQLKQRLTRKGGEADEITAWALDGDEEGDEGIYANAQIPDEAAKVRELIGLVPDGTDRKFDTLLRAIEEIRQGQPSEKFIIFTQYRETLEFLREEFGKLYGTAKIATIKGGPLEDKIAAAEAFWDLDGARFLVSTSAGGEGINLQVGHILFNYDLPWNPMAVEQRIGRIHRYGQHDTAQVYNLVAEDTVEERIYGLLEEKLLEIARTIGKVDPIGGEVVEDFRAEILGFLGSSPDYQGLYRKALVDRDYKRTEREIADAIEQARQASEALRTLAQDLKAFNLEQYQAIRGHFTLFDLRTFAEKAILRLGGVFIPQGEFIHIETPAAVLGYSNVARSYDNATFDREVAMRRRKAHLMGLGHPLIDALIAHIQGAQHPGEVASLSRQINDNSRRLSARCVLTAEFDNGRREQRYVHFMVRHDGSSGEADARCDIQDLEKSPLSGEENELPCALPADSRQRLAELISATEGKLRAAQEGLASVRTTLVGLAIIQ
jgi:superfamily II DNA or RNA helicase